MLDKGPDNLPDASKDAKKDAQNAKNAPMASKQDVGQATTLMLNKMRNSSPQPEISKNTIPTLTPQEKEKIKQRELVTRGLGENGLQALTDLFSKNTLPWGIDDALEGDLFMGVLTGKNGIKYSFYTVYIPEDWHSTDEFELGVKMSIDRTSFNKLPNGHKFFFNEAVIGDDKEKLLMGYFGDSGVASSSQDRGILFQNGYYDQTTETFYHPNPKFKKFFKFSPAGEVYATDKQIIMPLDLKPTANRGSDMQEYNKRMAYLGTMDDLEKREYEKKKSFLEEQDSQGKTRLEALAAHYGIHDGHPSVEKFKQDVLSFLKTGKMGSIGSLLKDDKMIKDQAKKMSFLGMTWPKVGNAIKGQRYDKDVSSEYVWFKKGKSNEWVVEAAFGDLGAGVARY